MPYIRFSNSPETIGIGRTASNVSYRHDQTNWIAQVDQVLEGEQELTLEEYQAQITQNQEWETQNPEPPQAEVILAPTRPTIEDILAVLPKEITDALDTRLLEKSQSDGV